MSDWTWEYVPDAANVVGGLTQAHWLTAPARALCDPNHDAKLEPALRAAAPRPRPDPGRHRAQREPEDAQPGAGLGKPRPA
jgi:hypothetical protein